MKKAIIALCIALGILAALILNGNNYRFVGQAVFVDLNSGATMSRVYCLGIPIRTNVQKFEYAHPVSTPQWMLDYSSTPLQHISPHYEMHGVATYLELIDLGLREQNTPRITKERVFDHGLRLARERRLRELSQYSQDVYFGRTTTAAESP